ncbi:MAG: tetratricopeptide repeat protein [Armatimonadota bacterium]
MADEYDIPGVLLDGITLFKQGRYKDAIPLLKEKLAASPDDIEARVCLAVSYSRTGNTTDAIQEFTRLTELQPDEVQNLFNLGMAYQMANDLYKAKECFERVITRNPNHDKAKEQLNAVNQRLQSPSTQGQPIASAQPYSQFNDSPPPQGLNWGAFLLPFFWSIAHSAWLWVVLSPFIHLVASIVLLIKGNEIAYQNRKFANEAEFQTVQKAWTMWGLILLAFTIVVQTFIIAMIYIGIMMIAFGAAVSIPYFMEHSPEIKSVLGTLRIQPGTGTLTTIKPYPGSQKINTVSGKDDDGGYTMTNYSTSADIETVRKSFESQFKGTGMFAVSSLNNKANMEVSTAFGMAKVGIASQEGKTLYHIKIYKIKAINTIPPFPKGLPAFPKDFLPMPKPSLPTAPPNPHPGMVM